MARNVSVREIYFYVICLTAIIIFIIGFVGLADGIINYIKPNNYMYQQITSYQAQYPNMSAEEIDKLMRQETANSLANERVFALKTILRNTIMVVIAIPLFALHWRKAQQLWHVSQTD